MITAIQRHRTSNRFEDDVVTGWVRHMGHSITAKSMPALPCRFLFLLQYAALE